MYTYTHLEDYTQKVFEKTNIYTPNELNLSSIAKSLNVRVGFIDGKSQSTLYSGCDYIFLNSALSPLEHFEVFGHELGHIPCYTRAIRSACGLIIACTRNEKRIYLHCIFVCRHSCCNSSPLIT